MSVYMSFYFLTTGSKGMVKSNLLNEFNFYLLMALYEQTSIAMFGAISNFPLKRATGFVSFFLNFL